MKLRAPSRLFVVGSTVLMVVVFGALGLATSPKQVASGTSISGSCPKNEPVQKCTYKVPSNFKPVAGPPITRPASATLPPSPSLVNCGASFVSAATTALIDKQFGQFECFRFQGERTWVLTAHGVSLAPSAPPTPPSPGGPVVALDTCAPGDSTCMDANANHPLSDWTLYYPPGPIPKYGMPLQATYGGRLIVFGGFLGSCGQAAFDITTHSWVAPGPDVITLFRGKTVTTIPAPAPVPATNALTQATPPRTNVC